MTTPSNKMYNIILVSLLCYPFPSSPSATSTTTEGTDVQEVDTTSEESLTTEESADNTSEEADREIPVNDSPSSHLRPSEMGIPVGEALEPPLCPPPPVTRSLGICYLKKCSSHQDCSRDAACCFNGCIHTCVKPMDRPAAFDWIEDTSKILPILDMDIEESPQPFFPIPLQNHPPQFEAAEAGEELVHLPGGCYISASRYQKLKEFMKAPSIKQCRCNDGEVVCDVRTEKS